MLNENFVTKFHKMHKHKQLFGVELKEHDFSSDENKYVRNIQSIC